MGHPMDEGYPKISPKTHNTIALDLTALEFSNCLAIGFFFP